MQDKLTLVKRIIDEHQTVKQHVKLVGDSVSDQEALNALQKEHSNFIPGRPEIISEKQKRLQQTMAFLEGGLKNHFDFEEKVLPPLLGELLTQALALEHQEIKRQIEEDKSTVTNIRLEGLSREELLEKEAYIEEVIDALLQSIEGHAAREETVLGMLQSALENQQV
jgi:hemerythrin